MIFSGTEAMLRYPHIQGSDKKGICSYGTIKAYDDLKAYKASGTEVKRLASVGWKTVGNGKHYIYVRKGA